MIMTPWPQLLAPYNCLSSTQPGSSKLIPSYISTYRGSALIFSGRSQSPPGIILDLST